MHFAMRLLTFNRTGGRCRRRWRTGKYGVRTRLARYWCCRSLRPSEAEAAAHASEFGSLMPELDVAARAAQESDIPNFKGSYLGRLPLVFG